MLRGSDEAGWTEAVRLAYREPGALVHLKPVLAPGSIVDARSLRRAASVVRAMMTCLTYAGTGSNLVPALLSRKVAAGLDAATWAAHGPALLGAIVDFIARDGFEPLLTTVVATDVDDSTLASLAQRLGASQAGRRRAVEALRDASQRAGTDREALRRIAVVKHALGLKVSATKPRPVPEGGIGTDGGPFLALDAGAVTAWRGAKGRGPGPTDYERACEVPDLAFLDVGEARALVLGHTGCDYARLGGGGVLLELAGRDADVGDALATKRGWRRLRERLAVPSGSLVLFEALAARGRSRNKAKLEVAPGSYAVEVRQRHEPSLWLVRLVAS